MFELIEDGLVGYLQANLTKVPKRNILKGKADLAKKVLPIISIYNVDFTFEELSLGSEAGAAKEELKETFSGDGKEKFFATSVKPLRPIISLESPKGDVKREGDDFSVNYNKGIIMFRSPPEKGKDNISVAFQTARGAAFVRGLKVNSKYFIDVWTEDKESCDDITVDAINALLLGRDELAQQGLTVRPIGGYSLDGKEESSPQGVGKRLEYRIETELYAKIPAKPIEKVELQQKELIA